MEARRVLEVDEEPPWAELDATGNLRDDADDFEDALHAQAQRAAHPRFGRPMTDPPA